MAQASKLDDPISIKVFECRRGQVLMKNSDFDIKHTHKFTTSMELWIPNSMISLYWVNYGWLLVQMLMILFDHVNHLLLQFACKHVFNMCSNKSVLPYVFVSMIRRWINCFHKYVHLVHLFRKIIFCMENRCGIHWLCRPSAEVQSIFCLFSFLFWRIIQRKLSNVLEWILLQPNMHWLR